MHAWAPVWLVAGLVLTAVCGLLVAVSSRAVAAEGAPAVYIGASGESLLLAPDGITWLLAPFPTQAVDGASVALDPLGTTLATSRPDGDDREVILVSLVDSSIQIVPGTRERTCTSPSFHPDGAHLLAVCDLNRDPLSRSIELFHREQGHLGTLVQGGTAGIQFVLAGAAVSPDGSWALVREALGDYAVRQWRLDLVSGQIQRLLVPDPEYAFHLETFLPDGRILATRCAPCAALGPGEPSAVQADVVVLRPDGAVDAVLHSTSVPIYRPALSPDSDTLLYSTATADGLQLWQLTRSTGHLNLVGSGSGAAYPQPSTVGGAGPP